MNGHSMTLVTVVCEALARQPLLELLHAMGIRGYTLFPVEGAGAKGDRPADIEEFGNIQVEVILPAEAAAKLMERLSAEFLPRFAAIVYGTEVRVLRPEKFRPREQ
jgi:nitrogen regulatory protein PII